MKNYSAVTESKDITTKEYVDKKTKETFDSITKESLGLGNVNNTADANKYVNMAKKVHDYGTSNKATGIEIGYSGNSLTTATYLAAYGTHAGNNCIKDISIANVKKLLGEMPSKELTYSEQITSQSELDSFYTAGIMKIAKVSNVSSIGLSANDGIIISIPYDSSYGVQIALDDNTNLIKVRIKTGGSWRAWDKLYPTNGHLSSSAPSGLANGEIWYKIV